MAKYIRPKRVPLPGQVAVPDPAQAKKRKIAPTVEPVKSVAEEVKPATFFKSPKGKK